MLLRICVRQLVFVNLKTVSTTSPSLIVPKSCDNLSNVITGASDAEASATVALSFAFAFFDGSVEQALRRTAKNKICMNFMR